MRRSEILSTAIIIIAILLFIAAYMNSVQPGISDTDPSTYVIIPILMLPIFFIFKLKEKILPEVRRKDIAIGVLLSIIGIIFTIYMKYVLSFEFSAFGIGFLMLPVFVASFSILAYGIKNLKRFVSVIIYSIFTSPIILLPVLLQNQNFTAINSVIVYWIEKLFISGIKFSPPITITLNNISIGIGQSCVGLGAIFGLLFMLVPLAYFYDGTNKGKAKWVISGILLLLLLNIARMSIITSLWFAAGPSQTLLTIHLFIGVLLFYLTLIIMILAARKFGLEIPRFNNAKGKKIKEYSYALAAAVVIGIIYYAIFSYGNSYISPMNLTINPRFNLTQNYTIQYFNSAIKMKNYTSEILIYDNNTAVTLYLYNKTTTNRNITLVILTKPYANPIQNLLRNSTPTEAFTFMNSSGYIATYYQLSSNGSQLSVFERSEAFQISPYNYTEIKEYTIIPNGLFSKINVQKCQPVDWHSYILNLFDPAVYNSTELSQMNSRYCIYNSLVSR